MTARAWSSWSRVITGAPSRVEALRVTGSRDGRGIHLGPRGAAAEPAEHDRHRDGERVAIETDLEVHAVEIVRVAQRTLVVDDLAPVEPGLEEAIGPGRQLEVVDELVPASADVGLLLEEHDALVSVLDGDREHPVP